MRLADGCDTGLALGLSCTTAGKPSPPVLRRDQPPSEPSLTLSLSDEVYGPNTPPARPSSPGWSTVTTFSAVKRERAEEKDGGGGGGSDDEEEEGSAAARKKLRLTKEQSALLEERFKEHSTLNPKQKQALAKQLNLRPRQVEVWFQNRRARTKLKQTEVDCEFLKRCCETLTEENRRLHKEVQELRAIKLAPPPLYMQIPAAAAAAATLAMCPSCERGAAGAGGDHGRPPNNGGGHFVVAPKARFFSPFAHQAVV